MNLSWMEKFIPKNKNTAGLYIILIIGIVILALGSSLFGSGGKGAQKAAQTQDGVLTATEQTERRLNQILSQIRGAGGVSVMISYESTGENVLAADTDTETAQSQETDKSGAPAKSSSSLRQESRTVTPGSAPVVTKQIYPKVRGVVVVAEGAKDPTVRQDLIHAVKSALDVADHKIGVFVKK